MELNPGFNKPEDLWNINFKRMERFVNKIIPFFNINKNSICADMGERNPKMEYIKKQLNINVSQIYGFDFNFDKIPGNYDIIFALEVIEHLQNPLLFMRNLRDALNNNGSIYVTIPCNPKWLWMEGHYNEISPKRFKKWILIPLGLKIERYKRVYFIHDWKGIFIGFRPLVRVLKGKQGLKSLLRTFLYFKYDFYEIKKFDL